VTRKQSKGVGFVEMGLDNEAQKAIAELNGKSFAGKPLTVSDAIQQHRSIYTNDGYNFG